MLASAIFSAITFATNFLYFTFFDLVSRGQSPGKRALGLRVVRDGGLPIDARSSLIRNFVRTADMLPGFYSDSAWSSIFLNKQHKRIGDLAGGTLVIRDHRRQGGRRVGVAGADVGVRAARRAVRDRPQARGSRAGPRFHRAPRCRLPDPARANIARQIAAQLGPRYGVDPTLAPDADHRRAGQKMSDDAVSLAKAVARLDVLVDQGRRNPRALTRDDLRDLPIVYRRVSAALAEARAHNAPSDQLARIERVLISAHGMLYAPEPPRPGERSSI